ncbi:MAG: ribonuclease HI, partial [Polyangiales bacterium]
MPWRKARFKQSEVLARCDEHGQLVVQDGRVEIRYRPSDARAYRAGERNLSLVAGSPVLPDDACAAVEPAAAPSSTRSGGSDAPLVPAPDGAIVVYADGACSGNPGPAGVGIVLLDHGGRRELSHFLGEGTNNIAELQAIELALDEIADHDRPVRIYTDSQYAIGVLSKGWKAKANVELVKRVRGRLAARKDVQFHYVRGHSGVPLNERADALAV